MQTRLPLIALTFVGAAPVMGTLPAYNPIDSTIPTSSLSAELVDVIRIPNSGGAFPRLEYMTYAPDGTDDLYVADQRGRIYRFQPGDLQAETFLDVGVAPQFNFASQRGVRGFAFHPDYATPGAAGEGKFFVAYSADATGTPDFPVPVGANNNHHSVVAEYTLGANGLIDPNSRRDIMRIAQPFGDHNIGNIAFNPTVAPGSDDYDNLYIALGDGGNVFPAIPTDPFNTGQDLGSPLGSILRIDPLQNGDNAYTVPDNPFNDTPGALDEIWAYGLRNPHNITWDLGGDHKMLIADIGQDSAEEINLGAAGANYGWDVREGTFDVVIANTAPSIVDTLPANHATDEFTYPVAQYDHDWDNNNTRDGLFAVAGGQVYRDAALSDFQGKYIFGDFSDGQESPILIVNVDDLVQRDDFSDLGSLSGGFIAPLEELTITRDGVPTTLRQIIRDASGNQNQGRTDMRFAVDRDGGVFILNKRDGWIRKLLPGPREDTDFNFSGFSDAADIDALYAAFGNVSINTAIFNLDDTGPSANVVDDADLLFWLALTGNVIGDANLNGQVEQGDLDAVLQNWGSTSAANPQLGWATGDLDGNGLVGQGDLDRVLQNWGSTAAADFRGTNLPEPSGLALLAVTLLRRRPRPSYGR